MTANRAYWIIASVVIISLVFFLKLPGLKFNYEFENFFEIDDPDWLDYQDHISKFGHDNDYLLVAVTSEDGIYNSRFLNRLDSMAKEISALPGVTQLISPLSAKKIIQSPLGTVLLPYLHPSDEEQLQRDSLHLLTHPNMAEKLMNAGVRSAGMIVFHERSTDKDWESNLALSIEKIVERAAFDDSHVAGRIRAQSVFIELIQGNFALFLLISIAMIIIVLSLLYRSFIWVIIPFIVIGVSIAVSLSILTISGKSVDVLTSMMPTILLVTGMSDIVHFLTRYFELKRSGSENKEAVHTAMKEVGLATFLTSLTTAIGFSTLLITDSIPISNLGLFTAIGIIVTYVVTFSLVPSTAVLLKGGGNIQVNVNLDHGIRSTFDSIMKRKNSILISYGLFAILSFVGLRYLVVDTPLIADFPRNHDVTTDFKFFDDYYGGSKPLEIKIVARSAEILSPEVMTEVNKVSTFLSDYSPNLLAPTNLIQSLNMANHGGQPEFYVFPEGPDERKVYRQFPQTEHHFPINLISEDRKTARITGFSKDTGSKQGIEFAERFDQFVDEQVNRQLVDFKLTGTSYLFDLTTENLVNNIIYGLTLAIGAVVIIMIILFRSFKMIVIALIPNLLPLVFLGAFMAIADIPMRLSTSIIFAIAFGIAVDDTIHFLTRYHLELRNGSDRDEALRATYYSTGRAMIITTLILVSGFLIFTFSTFDATFYTGLLISFTLIIALITDLTLLPVLLNLLYRKK